jgi:hypothetical protein
MPKGNYMIDTMMTMLMMTITTMTNVEERESLYLNGVKSGHGFGVIFKRNEYREK